MDYIFLKKLRNALVSFCRHNNMSETLSHLLVEFKNSGFVPIHKLPGDFSVEELKECVTLRQMILSMNPKLLTTDQKITLFMFQIEHFGASSLIPARIIIDNNFNTNTLSKRMKVSEKIQRIVFHFLDVCEEHKIPVVNVDQPHSQPQDLKSNFLSQ